MDLEGRNSAQNGIVSQSSDSIPSCQGQLLLNKISQESQMCLLVAFLEMLFIRRLAENI